MAATKMTPAQAVAYEQALVASARARTTTPTPAPTPTPTKTSSGSSGGGATVADLARIIDQQVAANPNTGNVQTDAEGYVKPFFKPSSGSSTPVTGGVSGGGSAVSQGNTYQPNAVTEAQKFTVKDVMSSPGLTAAQKAKGVAQIVTSNVKDSIKQFKAENVATQEDLLRRGYYAQGTNIQNLKPYEARGTTTQTPTQYTDKDLAQFGQAGANVFIERTKKTDEIYTKVAAENVANAVKPKYEQELGAAANQIQERINRGEISLEQGKQILEEKQKDVSARYVQEAQTTFDATTRNYFQDRDERVKAFEKSFKNYNLLRAGATAVALGVGTGIGFSMLAGVVPVAAEAAGVGLEAKAVYDTTKVLKERFVDKTIGNRELGEFVLTGALFTASAAGVGALFTRTGRGSTKIRDLVEEQNIRDAIKRADPKTEATYIGTEKQLNAYVLKFPELSARGKTILERGGSIALYETKLVPSSPADAKIIPDIRSRSIEFRDRTNNIVQRRSLGEVVAIQKGKTFKQGVIDFGVQVLKEGTSSGQSIIIKGKISPKGEFVPTEAYKLAVEGKNIASEKLAGEFFKDLQRTGASETNIYKVGESTVFKKGKVEAGQIKDLVLRDVTKTNKQLVGKSSSIYNEKIVKTKADIKLIRKGNALAGFGFDRKVIKGRGLSTFKEPDLFKEQKGKSGSALFKDIYKESPKSTFEPLKQGTKKMGTSATALAERAKEIFRPKIKETVKTGAAEQGYITKNVAEGFDFEIFKETGSRAKGSTKTGFRAGTRDVNAGFSRAKLKEPSLDFKQSLDISTGLKSGTQSRLRQITTPKFDVKSDLGLNLRTGFNPGLDNPKLDKPGIPGFFGDGSKGGGSRGRKLNIFGKEKPFKYQADAGSALIGLSKRVSRKKLSKLNAKEFSGLELRPVLEIK